ncbi:hypothetical protein CC1G_00772 [Coprinopsis cinerea okayama7|uniref:RanBD1 domain-containing protein n=1 Tax=Coprinopsis cinerea (strain Okayama-7 / 130 / ATCC MYA-4618 / FGSC 9003) TaxID=240176 RepID=A8N8P7_COPC7|nr:hypothetical protein CC1G_00772 [Coprinopsis cinerea okayama7\|eukprot:XP_001831225.2 hypothetical protein CC1G_00772 [Coprinopsis cinerea okayama7\
MSDGQRPPTLPQAMRNASPTPSPPTLDTSESETKLSRKREREVSLEPATPSATEIDAIPRDRKDSRTPAKKNRRYLSTTVEEEDGGTRSRSNSVTPPMSVSPPHEMKIKVRQISQGVEDLTWRNMVPPQDPKDEDMPAAEGEEDGKQIETGDSEEQQQQGDAENGGQKAQAHREHDATSGSPPSVNGPSSHGADAKTDKDGAVSGATTHDDRDASRSRTPDLQAAPDVIPAQPVKATAGAAAIGGRDAAAQGDSSSSRLRAYSESGEKGVKRKFLERGTSQGPPEAGVEENKESSGGEALKRPRDEADKDDNPRETKRPSPPPEKSSTGRTSPPSPKVPKLSGFMAYASTSSPFASVKGKNLFASSKSSSPAPSLSSTPSATGFGAKLGESSSQTGGFSAFAGTSSPFATATRNKSPPPLNRPNSPPMRSGFDAFSSAASPFASVARAKSPVLGTPSKFGRAKSPPRKENSFAASPFASYVTTGMSPFGVPKRRPGSPDGSSRSSLERGPAVNVFGEANEDSGGDDSDEKPSTFGERLRAGKDEEEDDGQDEPKEEEETLMQVRGKLYTLQGTQWKERGTGIIKINVKREDGNNPRLVMRKDAVYTLLLNVILFPGMRCTLAQDPRYLRFSAIEDGKTVHYNLRVRSFLFIRVSNAKIAQDFLDEINANIPAA